MYKLYRLYIIYTVYYLITFTWNSEIGNEPNTINQSSKSNHVLATTFKRSETFKILAQNFFEICSQWQTTNNGGQVATGLI